MSLHDLSQRMPYPGRVAMATARGAVLRARREGRWNDEAVAEILERDTWSDERWSAWTTERSTRLVTDAKRHVAAYAGLPDPEQALAGASATRIVVMHSAEGLGVLQG